MSSVSMSSKTRFLYSLVVPPAAFERAMNTLPLLTSSIQQRGFSLPTGATAGIAVGAASGASPFSGAGGWAFFGPRTFLPLSGSAFSSGGPAGTFLRLADGLAVFLAAGFFEGAVL